MNDPERTGPHRPGDNDQPAIDADPAALPQRIGRYRIERVLGLGGFGLVYLAHDEQLQRLVAIKVPHRELVDRREAAEAYLREARTVANLDHPHIVPVFDVGSTEEFPCYVVSKYIDGTDLKVKIRTSRLSPEESVELVATVAEALHHAHKQGITHRDIKPGNILLDTSGKPFVVDFGLALREQDIGTGPRYAGTPAYMSPEQARGEGHRVDGRSDIFSLGVVFYQLLSGRRPFHADAQDELLEQITSMEARPPRQWDDTIPKELERICLKALSKRASDRYTTAKDMADDLRHWSVVRRPWSVAEDAKAPLAAQAPAAPSTPSSTDYGLRTTDSAEPIKIVPKGLRSFDAADADFFLELLPGPRDREGLPDSIRFWKTRIETTDADSTFAVGLIYGPSGCGKSSLVKAGLLPRLAQSVTAVYVEATAEETEARLLKGLRRQLTDLPTNIGLIESLAALRQGRYPTASQKVVLVLDQFEQWLHARRNEETTELVQALRHCDGGRVQCLVMVRDDFWLAVSRFMKALEVEILEGRNSALVDLFDPLHARRVLAAFGRAYRRLPENLGACTKEQDAFLDQAVSGLAQDGKVISVRLALFAEMVKGKPWTPATLKDVGGIEGVGVTFLEETFTASTAPPQHRLHQKGAQAVLKALLPESGTDIKGHMRSQQELLDASGYASRPKDFDELLRILDSTLRLITPTDPDDSLARRASKGGGADPLLARRANEDPLLARRANEDPLLARRANEDPLLARRANEDPLLARRANEDPLLARRANEDPLLARRANEDPLLARRANEDPLLARRANDAARYYQLTHDYLVPALREWLTRKQKETRRGRAELLLADRAAVWNARPENRQLPSLLQWSQIRSLTAKKNWTPPQKRMMRKAGRVHALRGLLFAVALALLGGGVYEGHGRLQARSLTARLLDATTNEVPTIVGEMAPYRRWLDRRLHDAHAQAEADEDTRKQLHASLALLPVDASQVDYLYGRLLDAEPSAVGVISDALAPHKDALLDRLWSVAEKPEKDKEKQRLRAAAALAKYDPASEKWAKVQDAVANDLVNEPSVYVPLWMESLRPLRLQLLPSLSVVYGDTNRPVERSRATDILGDYAVDQPQTLANLVMDADVKQFAIFLAKLKDRGEEGLPALTGEIDKKLPADASNEAKEKLAKRQANAALALLRMSSRIRQNARDEPPTRILANAATKAWTVLKHSPNPRARSYLIHRLYPFGVDAAALIKRVDEEPDVTIRRALLLSLGEYGEKELSLDDRNVLLPKLQGIYRTAGDPGLHAAAEWLLRTWKQAAWLKQVHDDWAKANEQREKRLEGIRKLLTKDKEKTPPQWYVNGQGQTMVVIPGPVEFMMGSPPTEAGRQDYELQHRRRIGRTFALAATPVKKEQFLRYRPKFSHNQFSRYPEPTCPIGGVVWYEAAAYCNWLSKEEGIPEDQWCYRITGHLIKLKAKYLSLTGYRLPTEAEMEYATRAGAITSRYFGETEELLPKYAWYEKNSEKRTWPVGSLKPNDLGFFDVQGNVFTWCQEGYKDYKEFFTGKMGGVVEDSEDELVIESTRGRVLRGGSFVNPPMDVRSAYRSWDVPANRNGNVGFRPARTFR